MFVCGSLALFKAKENEPTQTALTLFGAEEIAPTWCLTDWTYIVWKQATLHKKEDGEFPWKSPIQTLLSSFIAIRVVGVRSWSWSWVGFHVCQIFSLLFEDTTFSPCTHLTLNCQKPQLSSLNSLVERQWHRHTLDEGAGSTFTWTNLDPFEANWILELDLALDPSLDYVIDSPSKTGIM